MLHGCIVETVSLSDAIYIIAFYEFLYLFQSKCILTVHNCKFDCTRLFRAISKTFMTTHFESVIFGFSDTLPLIRQCTQKKEKDKIH